MKYVALLRGVNVGGNTMIKMSTLKEAVEKCGFENVSTYINSGNVIFETEENNQEKITAKIEEGLLKDFGLEIRVVVISRSQLRNTVDHMPEDWEKGDDLRRNVAFVKEPSTAEDIVKEIPLTPGIDSIKVQPGVIYMTSPLSDTTKSGFLKIIGKKIYKEITIRNYNTTKKVLELLES